MKTLSIRKSLLFLAMAMVLIASNALWAQDSAVVIKDVGCSGFVPGSGFPLHSDEKTHSTATPSGNTMLVCHFDIPEGEEPEKATRDSGFECGTYLGTTNNSKMVATPGGKATLTCKINGS